MREIAVFTLQHHITGLAESVGKNRCRINEVQYTTITLNTQEQYTDFRQYLMKVTLSVKADELKLAQLLSKFAEKYRMTYKLNRKQDGYQLEVELNSEDFGELIRRINHLKEATYRIEEMRGGGLLDRFNVSLLRTNADALVDKEATAKTDVDPVDGGIVKLGGELWLAKPDDCKIIKEGSKVRVIRVEGVSLIVEGANEKECTN
jgi:hypothetical protein